MAFRFLAMEVKLFYETIMQRILVLCSVLLGRKALVSEVMDELRFVDLFARQSNKVALTLCKRMEYKCL